MYLLLPFTFFIILLTNVLVLMPIQGFLLNSFFSLFFLLILPGALFLLILGIKQKSFWETISMVVGLSVALIMLVGLGANTFLPKFGVVYPLAKMPLVISLDILLLLLFVIGLFKYRYEIFNSREWVNPFQKIKAFAANFRRKHVRRIKGLDIILGLIVFVFPVLSVFGSISLNNGGGNFPTMVLLGGIGLYVFALAVFRDKVVKGIFPTALYFIGLSLLLITSLRGWHLSGHDVQFEYYIFQLTKQNQFWNIGLYKDAYNACLSITILPTILSNFLSLNDIYIYKVIFQIIFAFSPVVVYLFLKKYTTEYLAFIASFYFLAFPTFLNDMPMLNRQEIALLFFSLLLYVLFRREKIKGKYILLLLYSFGMVVSHYSTNYIAILLLLTTYLGYFVIRTRLIRSIFRKYLKKIFVFKKANKMTKIQRIPIVLIWTLVALTIVWNGLLTKTSNDVVETISRAVVNVGNIFKSENKSIDIAYSLFFSYQIDDRQFLDNYLKTTIEKAKEENVQGFYEPSTYSGYEPEIVPNVTLPLTSLGNLVKNAGVDVFKFNYFSRQFFAKFIQILIALGIFGMLYLKTKNKYDAEYVIASFAGVFLIALMVILPGVSLSYGLLRLFQQQLILLGLPVVLGSLFLFKKIGEAKQMFLVGTVSVLFFWSLSGFFSEASGGYYPQLHLRDSGIYYDAYYVHEEEASSIKWLSDNMAQDYTVQADPVTKDRLLAHGPIYTLSGNFPQTIRKGAYFYAGYFNLLGKTVISVDRPLIIKFPLNFLDENKDLIFNNGFSGIYF